MYSLNILEHLYDAVKVVLSLQETKPEICYSALPNCSAPSSLSYLLPASVNKGEVLNYPVLFLSDFGQERKRNSKWKSIF